MVYGKNKYLWKEINTLWENSKIYENLSIHGWYKTENIKLPNNSVQTTVI